MAVLAEVRRFLHCNYNCTDLDRLDAWYRDLFDLRQVMRSDTTDTDGRPFGLNMPTASNTSFLYDHRGARVATSLELSQWTNPPTCGQPYADPWQHGLQSVAYRVPDLDRVAERALATGGALLRRTADAALLRDPEGLHVEVLQAAGEPEAHHLRHVVSDLSRSQDWYAALGFSVAPGHDPAGLAELWDGGPDHRLVRAASVVGTDEPTFALTLTQWSGPPPVGPPYVVPFHQGLYRMAVAVDDVWAAYDALAAAGVARQPPYTFPLPGTPIDEGLTILFLHDPDTVIVELVHRPRSIFRS